MDFNDIRTGIIQRHPAGILSTAEYRGELTIVVKKNNIVAVCECLKNEFQFDCLRDLFGLDMNTPGERFAVVYNLYSLSAHLRIRLKVPVHSDDCTVPSVTSVWSTADWHERETYDMFGISFAGHPDLRRIYMPEEFEYFPLRKDFPLMGIPDSLPLPKK